MKPYDLKEDVYILYRAAANLNMYVSVCKIDKQKIKNDLYQIKNFIDEMIAFLEE